MKKKSVSKSKDRDKNKNEDTKAHKHSRKKRKSSSESDGDSSDAPTELDNDANVRRSVSKKFEKETENNAVSGARTTRHSRRLAAINASTDELKIDIPDVLSSPVKTGKSSPFYIGSPSKDPKVINFYFVFQRVVVLLIPSLFSYSIVKNCCQHLSTLSQNFHFAVIVSKLLSIYIFPFGSVYYEFYSINNSLGALSEPSFATSLLHHCA